MPSNVGSGVTLSSAFVATLLTGVFGRSRADGRRKGFSVRFGFMWTETRTSTRVILSQIMPSFGSNMHDTWASIMSSCLRLTSLMCIRNRDWAPGF